MTDTSPESHTNTLFTYSLSDQNVSEQRFRLLVEGTTEFAMFLIDSQECIASWNEGARRIFGYETAEVIGQPAALIFTPEDRANGVPDQEIGKAAREGRAPDVRWHLRKDGSRFWADGVMERLVSQDGEFQGFAKVLRDATRTKEDAEHLAESEERYRTLVDSTDVGFCVIEVLFDEQGRSYDYLYLETNPAFEQQSGLTDAVGKTIREMVPRHDEFWFQIYGSIVLTGEAIRTESHAVAMGRWFDVYAQRVGKPEEHKIGVFFTDITKRKQVEEALRLSNERERAFLTEIFQQAPAFMAVLRGPEHIFELVNPPYHQLVGHRDILGKPVADALPEVVEQSFIRLLNQVYQTGEPFVGKGVPILLRTTPDSPLEERYLDFAYQPLRDEDGNVTGVLAHGIDLTERIRLEQEQERVLAEERARAEREALINQIGDGIRQSLAPEEIEANAVAALGKALHADRCYVFTADSAHDALKITRDWHTDDIRSLAGQYSLSAMGINVEAVFGAGKTLVVSHLQGQERLSEQNASTNQQLQVTSIINVPFYEKGRFIGALGVAMANTARQWSDEEISLVETVAGQLRSVLEAAQLQQRERNIARQLQEALQPAIPTQVPGLTLASYYRSALSEAEVGGDFMDVYSLGKNRTVLVVADLSGKGLGAASQVSLVRNQLRYALYTADLHNSGSVAEVAGQVSSVLVEHELLTGFATLFVGIWDADTRTLTYVNAGQEPGLIWRVSTGTVDMLHATAPVFGGFVGGRFTEAVVTLAPGDVLALFTDGMTEVGPSRKEFLEIDGLAGLFAWGCTEGNVAELSAALVLNRLISGVEAHAGSAAGLRDDIALLVGLAT